ADVLVTIEYTALDGRKLGYDKKVIDELSTDFAAERGFSFKNQFADQWYDLNNPELSDTPMNVKFSTAKADFPANIKDIGIRNLLMYFVYDQDYLDEQTKNQNSVEIDIVGLSFKPKGSADDFVPTNYEAATVDRLISMRRSNGGPWASLLSPTVEG